MSWFSSASEWKQGLSSSVITKIDELENQNEKLKKERNQKQNQIDTLQQALDKQKRKIEDEVKLRQSYQKEVECLGRTCESLQEKLMKHGFDSNISPVGTTQIDSATSSEKLLMKKIEDLEEEKKILEQRFEQLNSNSNSNNNFKNKQVYVSDSQRDSWTTPLGGQGVELLQKSPLKVTVKKALETSEDNPFKAPTPVKKGLEISEESPFKTPVKCGPSGFMVGQPQLAKSHFAEDLEKKLALAFKQIDELKKENVLLVANIKPDSTVENDLKERLVLKTDDGTKSVTSSLGSELQQTEEQLSFYRAQSQIYERKAEDLEQKIKNLESELDCHRQNAESSKIRLEEKLKEKQKEHIEDTTRFQAELSTLEEQIRDFKIKLKQQETLFLSKENAMEGSLDKLKAQLSDAEKEKAFSQSQCGKMETSLAQLEKSEEEAKKLCSQLKQERDMVKAQVESLKIKLNDSEFRYSRLQSQFESSETHVASLKSAIEETLATHKDALNKEQETHKSEIDSITKEKEKDLKAKEDLILTLKEKMQSVKESLQEALRMRDEAEKRSAEVEKDCQTRLSEVYRFEQRISELEKSLAEKEKVISEGKTLMFEKVNATKMEADQKVCALEELLQEQLSSIASKEAEIKIHNEKLQKATETISSLISTLNGAKEKLDVYEDQLKTKSSLIKLEEENVLSIERRLMDAQTLLCSSREEFKESLQNKEKDIAGLQEENVELLNMKENLTWQVNDLNSKLKNKFEELEVLKESLSKALLTHTELKNETSSLQVKVEAMEKLKIRNEALTVDVKFYMESNDSKDKQLLELNHFIKSLNNDKTEVDETVKRLIEEKETERDRHREEVDFYMKRVLDLETSSQEVMNNFLDSQKSVENLKECNDILGQTLSDANNEIAELNSSNKSLNEKVEALLKAKEAIENENTKIIDDLFNVERMHNFTKNKLSEAQKTYFEDVKEKEERIKMISMDLERRNDDLKRIEKKVSHLEEMKIELQTRIDGYEMQINNLKKELNEESENDIASTSEIQNVKRDHREKEMEELTLELICKNDELDSKVQVLMTENSSLLKVEKINEDKLQSYLSENIFLEKEIKEFKKEKENLQSRMREIKMKCNELEKENEIAINANEKLIVENSDLISQRDGLKNKINMIEDEKECLREKLIMNEAAKEGLQEKVNVIEAERECLKEKVNMVEAEKDYLLEKMNIIETENEGLQKKMNLIEAENDCFQEKVNMVEAEKDCLQEKVNRIEAEKVGLQEKMDMIEAEVKCLQEKVNMIEVKKEVLLEKMNMIEAEKECLQEKVNMIESENEGLQEKVNLIEAEKESLQKKVNMIEAEKECLQEKVKVVETEKDCLLEKMNMIEAEKDCLQEKVNIGKAEKDCLQEKVNMIEAEKDSLQEKVNMIGAEKDCLKEKVNMIEAEKDCLQEKMNMIEAEKECFQEKVKGLEVEKKCLQEKVKILEDRKELQELLKDEQCEIILESLKASYFDSHSKDNDEGFALWFKENLCKTEEKFEELKEFENCNSELLREIESLKAKLKDVERDYDAKIVEIENLKDNVFPLKEKISKLEQEINDLLTAQNKYQALIMSLEQECDILRSKLDVFDTKLLKSENEKKDLHLKYISLITLNEGYNEKYNHLQNTINSLMSEIASLKEISEKKTKEIERLQNEKESLITEKVDCKRLEEEIENLRTHLNTCMQRDNDMQNRVGELIANESVLRQKLEQTENLKLSLDAEMDSLKNDVCTFKLENEALKNEKQFVIEENVSLNVLKTELLNKIVKFENEMRKEDEKIAVLRQQCKDFDNTKKTLEDLIDTNKTFENLLKEKEAKILEMGEKSQNLEANFKSFQEKFDIATEELTESKKAVEILLSEKENLLLDKSSLCQKLAESENALQEELEKKKVNELRDAREELKQIQEKLEQQKQIHYIQVNEMQQKVQEFSEEKMNLHNILSEKERKLHELDKNIAEYKENVARLEARFELSQKNSHRMEKEFEKLREHQRKLKSKLKEREVALETQMSTLTKSELKQRDLQELLDAKSRKCDDLDALYNQISAEKDELLKTINNLRDKANQLEVQKRKLEKDLSKGISRRKPFFSGESTSQSESSQSVIELSQVSLMGIPKAITRKAGPISGMAAKRRGRRSGRRSIAPEDKTVSREEQKVAAYDKFMSIVSSSKEEALKKEGSSRRLTRSSLSVSQESVKRSLTTSDSSVEESRHKKFKLGQNHEGLPNKVCKGLNDIPMGQDSPGVLTRPTTPMKISGKTEKEDNRGPLKSLNVNNDAGRVPSSPKEKYHDEVIDFSADEAHVHLEAAIQKDSVCHRRSSLYPRKGSRKNIKDCNAQ